MTNAHLHFILKFDMIPPYDQAYRRAAEALPCSSIVPSGPMAADSAGCTIILCDTDASIERYKTEDLPVIAVSHEGNASEELMGTPWLILSPDALTPEFLYEVYCRYYRQPMWILETERCRLRELCSEDLTSLKLLQQENVRNPDGCFFPADCASPEEFLSDYIRHQYPFFCFGLYAVLEKEAGNFMGIAGFARITENTADEDGTNCSSSGKNQLHRRSCSSAEMSYSFLQQYQHRGIAKEVLRALLDYGREQGRFEQFTARIRPENVTSAALAKKCGITIYYDESY